MNEYEAKQEARRERLRVASARSLAASEAALGRARSIADGIPFGQPVLRGHHSEKRHLRDVDRIDRGFRKAHEQHEAAKELERRAAAVGTGGISSDDPEAITKLRAELTALEAKREKMKLINGAYRQGAKAGGDVDGWLRVAELLGAAVASAAKHDARFNTDRRSPYPAYALTNLGANIRRVQARIAELEQRAAATANAPIEGRGVRIVEREDINRVTIVFAERCSKDEVAMLKSGGWRWSPTEKAWMRQLNENGRYAARRELQQMGRLDP